MTRAKRPTDPPRSVPAHARVLQAGNQPALSREETPGAGGYVNGQHKDVNDCIYVWEDCIYNWEDLSMTRNEMVSGRAAEPGTSTQ